MTCPDCGTDNEAGRKFCGECGEKLALACPQCGAANTPGVKFCGECGVRLAEGAPAPAPASPVAQPEAERRLVSVLFADLVGFTSLSEKRDPEETRELLSAYFDAARTVIGRYGGTVEKFIGDAVMAVWGAPVAHEDDAERAVRAALDLVETVAGVGAENGPPDLRLRAGVASGEAAVTLGAEGQGMVAGDLVNTAARIQSVSAPATVLVDDTTHRMTEAAVAYEDAGEHELKGKAEPARLWRAMRIVAGRRGDKRAGALEAPFVGRAAELRVVKELFHATADEGGARLVSVIGVAGMGKSRLAWEFDKYTDGLIDEVWWHKGRCLPYGEGVAYWALAEMVRMRAGILEEEAPETAAAKLAASVRRHLGDPEERAWVEPRLAHLLGLAERTAPDQQDLFSAWRRFFERMAEEGPVVLLFEDLHWADAGLLDFVEYLLEWSRAYPLFILTLARPELLERRPTWGAGKRSFTSLVLEPLPEEARDELLQGLVPGLPDELRSQIVERAEGVPLYAIEIVRMLLDRALIERADDGEFRVTSAFDGLDVPETLQALIAARLDGLDPAERRLLQDASVLGKTFVADALAAVSGLDRAELEPILRTLVHKEILSVDEDRRSPERGQYGFLHALVQKVAYDTLARKERKARHLAVARYLGQAWPDEAEIAEVVAAHFLEAYRAEPEAADALEIKATARECLARAAERAASLAASEEAQRSFVDAAELADEPLVRAELLERAGEAARSGARFEEAAALFEGAIELLESEGHVHPAARVSARLGEVFLEQGRNDAALARLQDAFAVLSTDEPDADLATLAVVLARTYRIVGATELAAERVELALQVAEVLDLHEVVARALSSKAIILDGRPAESEALGRQALRIALEHGQGASALRAAVNLGHLLHSRGRVEEAVGITRDSLALARRRGDRPWEWFLLSNLVEFMASSGEWAEALSLAAELPDEARHASTASYPVESVVRALVEQGRLDEARALAQALAGRENSDDYQDRAYAALALAALARAEGDHATALRQGETAFEEFLVYGDGLQAVDGLAEAAGAAFSLGDVGQVESILARCAALRPVERIRYLRAQELRLWARLAATRGDDDSAAAGLRQASAEFRGLEMPFWLAVTLVESAELLVGRREPAAAAEPLLEEARGIFERLGAQPWLDRLARLTDTSAAAVA
ncbi:MAG: adenylate/guanylate cyclase domain-containing protein [Gaiellales bacterium]